MNIKVKDITNVTFWVMLYLASMNFMAKYFYFIFAIFALYCLLKKKIQFNNATYLYLLLGFLMALYCYDDGAMAMMRCFGAPFAYLIGYNLSQGAIFDDDSNEAIQKRSYILLSAIAYGSFTHFILNFLYNLGSETERNTKDIWSGTTTASTGQAAMGCIMIGFAVALVIASSKKWEQTLGVFLLLSILLYNFVLAGRTLIIILAITAVIGYFYWSRIRLQRSSKFLWILGLCFLLLLAYVFNIGGVRTFVEESNFFLRFADITEEEILESGRGDKKMFFLQNSWKYPFGGLHMRDEVGYAHDLLLDAYDEFGFLSLFLLLGILYDGIKKMIFICRDETKDVQIRVSFVCVYIALLLEFCVEPIFAGMQWLFVSYSLINGCLARMYQKRREVDF